MSANEQYNKDLRFIEKIDSWLDRRYDHSAFIFSFAACLLAHVMYLLLFWSAGVNFMAFFNVFSVLFYVVMFLVINYVKDKITLVYATIAEIIVHAAAATVCVGLASNFAMLLLMLVTLAFLMPNKNKYAPFVVMVVAVTLYGILCFVIKDPSRGCYDLSGTNFPMVFYIINIVVGSVVLIYAAILFTIINTYRECRLRIQTEQLKIMASTDPLTKLNNRREIQKTLNEVSSGNYIIGIGDIDDFKYVNDTYGHDMGDVVLASVAELIGSAIPDKARAARWGGEEFLFVIPDADIEEGRRCADGIIERIRAKKFTSGGKEFSVTMTIGICLGTPEDTVDKIISQADERLYKGKQSGKNQTVFE